MIRKALVEYCAPTLAGIKTGNIFSVKNDHMDINGEIRKLNRILVNKGLRLVPLRNKGNTTLIYLYRPERLKDDLGDPGALEILREKGYPCGDTECCLVKLVNNLKSDDGFPHEIGLFLGYPPRKMRGGGPFPHEIGLFIGYPPEDVQGFIENHARNYKCVGCWKVYSNEREARKTFDKYKRCTDIYNKESRCGKPLEALIVDTQSSVRFAV